jgi:hypothetical protein
MGSLKERIKLFGVALLTGLAAHDTGIAKPFVGATIDC